MDLLVFAGKVAGLKKLKRAGWVMKRIADPESVADHSFTLALLAYVYSREFDLDTGKCVRMALVHDICEAFSGDIPDRVREEDRSISLAKKREMEAEGMKKMLSLLPEGMAKEMHLLWQEFTERKTAEAKLVKDLDKLEMCMQALEYAKTNPRADLGEFFEDGKLNIKTPEIQKLFRQIHAEFKAMAEKKRDDI